MKGKLGRLLGVFEVRLNSGLSYHGDKHTFIITCMTFINGNVLTKISVIAVGFLNTHDILLPYTHTPINQSTDHEVFDL